MAEHTLLIDADGLTVVFMLAPIDIFLARDNYPTLGRFCVDLCVHTAISFILITYFRSELNE